MAKTSCMFSSLLFKKKIDGLGPIDNRPSTAEAPTKGKIHPFRKIAGTLEPVMRFRSP